MADEVTEVKLVRRWSLDMIVMEALYRTLINAVMDLCSSATCIKRFQLVMVL